MLQRHNFRGTLRGRTLRGSRQLVVFLLQSLKKQELGKVMGFWLGQGESWITESMDIRSEAMEGHLYSTMTLYQCKSLGAYWRIGQFLCFVVWLLKLQARKYLESGYVCLLREGRVSCSSVLNTTANTSTQHTGILVIIK